MEKYNILVADDDNKFIDSVKIILKDFNIISANTIIEAEHALSTNIDLVFLDLVFDKNNPDHLQGLELLEIIREKYPDLQVIVLTNYVNINTAIKAGNLGIGSEDFLNKGELNWSEWIHRIRNYCKKSYQIRELSNKNIELQKQLEESEIIGDSEYIEFVRRKLRDIAENSNDINLFIYGETGTGKNLAVKYFREFSKRKNKPFKEFSILELSEALLESELFGHTKGAFTGAVENKKGLFEIADGGILFLDEIGDYDLQTQKKIMRFIEDKTITPVGSTQSKSLDIQLIMATNQNIPELIKEGQFREDLYQRINRVKIELPPLRVRRTDIKILADYFFNHFRLKEKTDLRAMDDKIYEVFEKYSWPGNIRELQSVIWEACTNARILNDKILRPHHLRNEVIKLEYGKRENNSIFNDLELKIANTELTSINEALNKTYGNKTEAAKILKISVDAMRYKVMKYFSDNPYFLKEYEYIVKFYSYLFK